MAKSITASVGEGGKNNNADVTTIQTLLNKWIDPKLTVTGTCTGKSDDVTVKAIKTFQGRFMNSPDGRIDPGGSTLKKLNSEPLVLLPQMCGFGYYSYGKGDMSKRQWGTKATIETLVQVSQQFWWNNPNTFVGIGDISLEFGGKMKPHSTHREGKHVDMRPCRKDNALIGVNYKDTTNYDQEKTKLLVELLLSHKNVKSILFNDPVVNALERVGPWDGHDDHLHVTMRE
jgi:murein endopeptidase